MILFNRLIRFTMKNQKVVYLIRHAQSEYNILEAQIKDKYMQKFTEEQKKERAQEYKQTQQYLKLKFNIDLQDAGITELGFKQCADCAQKMEKIKLDLIIVSPKRRALMTCYEVFKNHEEKTKVIVDPAFRQIYESGCDIGSLLRKSQKDYPDYDYSLIKHPDYWYIEALVDQKIRNQLLKKVQSVQESQRRQIAKQQMLKFLKQHWDKRVDAQKQQNIEQAKRLKQIVLPSVSSQKEKLKLLLQKYNSIAVVTHSENIRSYIGQKPPNCSIFQFKQEHFNMDPNEIEKEYL